MKTMMLKKALVADHRRSPRSPSSRPARGALPTTAHPQTSRSDSVLGFAVGGPTDVIARVLAKDLTLSLGQSFIVDNSPARTR